MQKGKYKGEQSKKAKIHSGHIFGLTKKQCIYEGCFTSLVWMLTFHFQKTKGEAMLT